MRKKFYFLALLVVFASVLTSCVDYDLKIPQEEANPAEKTYVLKANSSVTVAKDTIYAGINNQILLFVTEKETDKIVAVQIDFGDGSIDGGTQVIHEYKTAGIYNLKIEIVGTTAVLNRIVKITGTNSTTGPETIVQLSGNTVGDSAVINLLCRKDKIYGFATPGKYYLKGDITGWTKAISPSDTAFVYEGVKYLLFSFKVKNYAWTSFGYYKAKNGGSEDWGYDPLSKYWDTARGLFKIYVYGAKIYSSELTTSIPGTAGDPSTSANGPVIRLDYESGTNTDSLVIFANRNYLANTDSTKLGLSYSVDGGAEVFKKARFIKDGYIYTKVPVTKSSTIKFKTWKNMETRVTGDMSSSIFWVEAGYLYLKIAGTVSNAPKQNVFLLKSGKKI